MDSETTRPENPDPATDYPPQSILPRSEMHRPRRPKRLVRNYFLHPTMQSKLGLYSVVLTMLYLAALGGFLFARMRGVAQIIFDLTDVEAEVREVLLQYLSGTVLWLVLISLAFALFNILISVIYTHRFLGPGIAFRRHIKRLAEGDYDAQTNLRKGDAFEDLATGLNNLSRILKRRHGVPSVHPAAGESHSDNLSKNS
jgi:hypothetical protein